MHKILLSLILLIGIVACNNGYDDSVTMVKNGADSEYIIHLQKITDSLSFDLSDIAGDFQFIPFETKAECIFDDADIYISGSYILVMKNKYGILQFDRTGKFIRTLVLEGEGPEEYSRAFWTVNEDSQILYISDNLKENYFLQYDLYTGEYMGDLRKAIPGQTKDIQFEDNSLIVVPSGGGDENKNTYYYYRQSLSGDLIYSNIAPSGFFMRGSEKTLHCGTSGYRYHIYDDDTIYSINGKQKEVFIVFDFGEKNPPNRRYVGHKSMSLNNEIGSFVYFYNFQITSIEKQGNVTYTSGAVENYVLDKSKGKAYHSGQIFFNPTHRKIDADHYQFSFFQSNGLLYYVYQAVDLLEHAERSLANPEFKEPYRSQLSKIVEGLTENDNPILLIGKLL